MMKKNVDTTKSAFILKELTVAQRKKYKADMLEYNMLEKLYERTIRELQTMNNVIKTSADQYISSNELKSFARTIIKLLAARYKLNDWIRIRLFSKFMSNDEDWKSRQLKTKLSREWLNEKISDCR